MKKTLSRRTALAGFAAAKIPPHSELVNVLEFESIAKQKLMEPAYAAIGGGDRSFFDRITFRPRMMVNTMALDLSTELFGEKLFAPILVGPVSQQREFHPEGELATVRGASDAKALTVIGSDSSQPIEKIAAAAKGPLWYQVFPGVDENAVKASIERGIGAGCKAVCITVRAPSRLAGVVNPALNWSVIDRLRQGIRVPVLLKGITSPDEAGAAVKRGIAGIVVSNYGGKLTPEMVSSVEMLPAIVQAVAGKAPVLIDGSFRRGSDILKALALGARGVLLARPVLWGLAAYGADGVRAVLEMLQTDLARAMAQCGNPNLASVDRTIIRIHES